MPTVLNPTCVISTMSKCYLPLHDMFAEGCFLFGIGIRVTHSITLQSYLRLPCSAKGLLGVHQSLEYFIVL